MVADNWVKKNPLISGLIGVALTCICSVAIAKATWSREDKKALQQELNKKVDVGVFDKEINRVDRKIDSKADKSLVESMDKKLDLILEKLP